MNKWLQKLNLVCLSLLWDIHAQKQLLMEFSFGWQVFWKANTWM